MNYWRMAFRVGPQGHEMWPDCRKRGIAAIGYYTENGKPIVGDCSKITEEQYNRIWQKKDPKNTAGRASLRNLAYRMRVGDVIYVKEGRRIVGRGKVTSQYQYDPGILRGTACEWEHFVRVEWEPTFRSVEILLGAELITVLQLSGERLQRLEAAVASSNQPSLERIVAEDLEALQAEEASFQEGEKKQRFTNYYERNPKLRAAVILYHGTRCSVCGFDFEATYGEHGKGYIEVHHLHPVSKLTKRTSVNPKTDMTVVCANCHRMIHRKKDGVLSLEQIRSIVQNPKRDQT